MNKTKSLLIIGLVLFLSISFFSFNQAQAEYEGLLLPIIHFKNGAFASDLTDFYLPYPPHYFNVSQQAKTDFAFNNTLYGVSMGFNGTMYAYEHTFDVKYVSSIATRNDAFIGEDDAYLQVSSNSGSGPCTLGLVAWGTVLGATVTLPLGSWVSLSMKVLYNLNQTNPTPNYKTLYENLTMYDYGFVGQSTHKLASVQGGVSRTDKTILDLLRTVDADYGGYLVLEVKNQRWYQPSGFVNVSVSSTPINSTVTWTDGIVYNLPYNFSIFENVEQTITATSPFAVNSSLSYLFQGWSINGSSIMNTSNPLIFTPTANTTLQVIYTAIVISDYSSTITFGIGLFGFILIGLSWVVGYHFYKEGDYRSMFFWGFLMLIFGYGLIWVIFGG